MLSLTAIASYAALLVAVFDPKELPGEHHSLDYQVDAS
jgi:hypothetical protein